MTIMKEAGKERGWEKKEETNCKNEELILEIKEAEKDDDKDIKTV